MSEVEEPESGWSIESNQLIQKLLNKLTDRDFQIVMLEARVDQLLDENHALRMATATSHPPKDE